MLSGKAVFCDALAGHIETIFQAIVDNIEAIAEAIGDTTQLSVDILSVETFKQVRTSQCALYGSIAGAAISKQSTISENC